MNTVQYKYIVQRKFWYDYLNRWLIPEGDWEDLQICDTLAEAIEQMNTIKKQRSEKEKYFIYSYRVLQKRIEEIA